MNVNSENAITILQALQTLAKDVLRYKDEGYEDGRIVAEMKTEKIINQLASLNISKE